MDSKILVIQNDILLSVIVFTLAVVIAFIFCYGYIKKLKGSFSDIKSKNTEYQELLTNSAASNKELLDENVNLRHKNNDIISKANREINSSINSIMGMANLLKDTSLNKEQLKNTNTIIECSQDLLHKARNIFNTNLNQKTPVVMNNHTNDKKPKHAVTMEFASEYPLRILIAEDDHINQILATKMLNKLGYKPDIVSNGKQALEVVSEKTYDVILMDGLMPEMDGFEATRMIRLCLERQPVIIALTASTMYGDKEKCLQAGMNDYISKPIDINELAVMLQKWAEERKVVVA